MNYRTLLHTCLLALCLGSVPVEATTYYVGTSGSDSNNGSINSRWRNPQKCAQPPVTAGDTCLVGDGTYTAAQAGSTAFVIQISSAKSSAAGTAANPITIQSENWNGAKIIQPSRNAQSVGIYVGRPYYIIRGFDVDGSTTVYDTGTNASHAGIGVYANNVTVTQNYIHHIARTQCSNSSFGNAALFVNIGLSNVWFDRNYIHTIGRLRNGESGCSTTIFQHDHGIYITWGSDITLSQNVCFDANRGYCSNIYSTTASVHTRYRVIKNTFAGRSPTGVPSGHMIIGGVWSNGEIKSNLFYQPDPDLIIQRYNLSTSSTGNVVSHNRTNLDIPGSNFLFGAATPTGFTSSNNTENTSLGLTNALCTQSNGGCQNTDFTLAAGSAAINAGTSVGLTCVGTCDQGAYEVPAFVSAEVNNTATNTIRITYNTTTSILPLTGVTGFTVSKNGSPATISSATASGNVISLVLSSGVQTGDTLTFSYSSSSGNATDAIRIGGFSNQPIHSVTNQSITNNVQSPNAPPSVPGNIRWRRV